MSDYIAKYPHIVVRPECWNGSLETLIQLPELNSPVQFGTVESVYEGYQFKPGDFVFWNQFHVAQINGEAIALFAPRPDMTYRERTRLLMFDTIPIGKIKDEVKILQIKEMLMEGRQHQIKIDYAKDVELRWDNVLALVENKPKSNLILPSSVKKGREDINIAKVINFGPQAAEGLPEGALFPGAMVAVPNLITGSSVVPFGIEENDSQTLRMFRARSIMGIYDESATELPWLPSPHRTLARLEYPGYEQRDMPIPGMKGLSKDSVEKHWVHLETGLPVTGNPPKMVARVIRSNAGQKTPAIPEGYYMEAWSLFSHKGEISPDCTVFAGDRVNMVIMVPTDRIGMVYPPGAEGLSLHQIPKLDVSKFQLFAGM